MEQGTVRPVLEMLEASGGAIDLRPPLAFLAGQELELDESELAGARRRALLLLAAGGAPTRDLDVEGRAVTALAADLDGGPHREQLARGLTLLRGEADDLPFSRLALDAMLSDAELAWRAFACALLADELAEDY